MGRCKMKCYDTKTLRSEALVQNRDLLSVRPCVAMAFQNKHPLKESTATADAHMHPNVQASVVKNIYESRSVRLAVVSADWTASIVFIPFVFWVTSANTCSRSQTHASTHKSLQTNTGAHTHARTHI